MKSAGEAFCIRIILVLESRVKVFYQGELNIKWRSVIYLSRRE